MNTIIISNTCLGMEIIKLNNILPYNNPFISTLIPNDLEFILLVNNFEKYINLEPVLGYPKQNTLFTKQNNGFYYKHEAVNPNYPVILLGDIDIHCIHEYDHKYCLNKFKRRLERCRNLINSNNYKIIMVMSFAEFINNHDNTNWVIHEYYKNLSNINISKIFIGPSKYKNNHQNYLSIDNWDNISLERNSSHVYIYLMIKYLHQD